MKRLDIERFKSLVKSYKAKQDVAIPPKRKDLIKKYHFWKNQPPPLFNDVSSDETDNCYINKNNNNNDIDLSNVALAYN